MFNPFLIQHFFSEDVVISVRQKLRGFEMPLTERELAILSCAVVELEVKGHDPWSTPMIVQVAPCCQTVLCS